MSATRTIELKRTRRATIGTASMHRDLDDMIDDVNGITLSLRRSSTLVSAQIPALNRLATNSSLHPTVQERIERNNVDSRAYVEQAHDLEGRIREWSGRADSLRNAIRHSDNTFPLSAAAQSAFEELRSGRDVISLGHSFLQNHGMLESNNRLMDYILSAAPVTQRLSGDTSPSEPASSNSFGLAGANAATAGPSAAMPTTLEQGIAATPATLASCFERGIAIHGHANHKRYNFLDGGHVEIWAHTPIATTTFESDIYTAGISVLGFLGGLGINLGTGFLVGTGAGIAAENLRNNDAAWQGYTAHFWTTDDAPGPWRERRFYGWKQSSDPGTAITDGSIATPADFHNFAEQSHTATWHTWSSGDAPLRMSTHKDSAPVSPQTGANMLIHSMSTSGTHVHTPECAIVSDCAGQAGMQAHAMTLVHLSAHEWANQAAQRG